MGRPPKFMSDHRNDWPHQAPSCSICFQESSEGAGREGDLLPPWLVQAPALLPASSDHGGSMAVTGPFLENFAASQKIGALRRPFPPPARHQQTTVGRSWAGGEACRRSHEGSPCRGEIRVAHNRGVLIVSCVICLPGSAWLSPSPLDPQASLCSCCPDPGPTA